MGRRGGMVKCCEGVKMEWIMNRSKPVFVNHNCYYGAVGLFSRRFMVEFLSKLE